MYLVNKSTNTHTSANHTLPTYESSEIDLHHSKICKSIVVVDLHISSNDAGRWPRTPTTTVITRSKELNRFPI